MLISLTYICLVCRNPSWIRQELNLLPPPGQKGGQVEWRLFEGKLSAEKAPDGETAYLVNGSSYGMNGAVTIIGMKNPLAGRQYSFELKLRATEKEQKYAIEFVGMDKSLRPKLPIDCEWSNNGELKTDQWTNVQESLVFPPGTTSATFVIHNVNRGPVLLASASLKLGPEAAPDNESVARAHQLQAMAEREREHPSPSPMQLSHDRVAAAEGPTVIRVVMRAPIKSAKPGQLGVVTFPIPSQIESQVPLAFKVQTTPTNVLVRYRRVQRKDGLNLVCEATVRPGTKGAWIQCESLVLVDKAEAKNIVGSPNGWLRSTACVQSADPEVEKVATSLWSSRDSSESYARKVYRFVFNNMGRGAPFKTLDARAGIECGGSCTNHANLAAALLRARGIPARTVAHMPTWCGNLYEHWLTEYWDGANGWVALDPSLGRWLPDARTRAILNIATPSDEDRSFDPLHERFVMPGAPYMAVTELSSTLYPADLTDDDAINHADLLSILTIDARKKSTLFRCARNSFPGLLAWSSTSSADRSRFDLLAESAKSKRTDRLIQELK